jgi:putative transposase
MQARFADVPDAIWNVVVALLPPVLPRRRVGGRPRRPDRPILAGIVYRLRTGCQWKALPAEFGSGSTCHRRFQQWCRAGVFVSVHAEMVRVYDRKRGAQLQWTSLDSATVKAPKGGTSPARTRPIARSSV